MYWALTQEAAKQLGAGYILAGEVQVKGGGTWAYQFSDRQLHHMAQLIAGKNRQEATVLLLEQPGVSQVAMTVSGIEHTSLPADAGKIRFPVLSRPL